MESLRDTRAGNEIIDRADSSGSPRNSMVSRRQPARMFNEANVLAEFPPSPPLLLSQEGALLSIGELGRN